jgi:hypothetical protein
LFLICCSALLGLSGQAVFPHSPIMLNYSSPCCIFAGQAPWQPGPEPACTLCRWSPAPSPRRTKQHTTVQKTFVVDRATTLPSCPRDTLPQQHPSQRPGRAQHTAPLGAHSLIVINELPAQGQSRRHKQGGRSANMRASARARAPTTAVRMAAAGRQTLRSDCCCSCKAIDPPPVCPFRLPDLGNLILQCVKQQQPSTPSVRY